VFNGIKISGYHVVERSPREVFQDGSRIDHLKSKTLAKEIIGAEVDEIEPLTLDLAIWPKPGIVCAASLPGLEVVSSRELAQYQPSRLTDRISHMAAGRTAYGVFMHSAEDWTAFAVWSGNDLIRALSLSPDIGIMEDAGEQLPFEIPFWGGEYPVGDHAPNYPFPFHPSELGNEALKIFFGFILEGRRDASCFDPEEVSIPAFQAASSVSMR
jgi:hypothetical protein